jgi:hypothetical protein
MRKITRGNPMTLHVPIKKARNSEGKEIREDVDLSGRTIYVY